jgi:hypothetical protein
MMNIWLPPGVVEGSPNSTPEWFAERRGLPTASRFGDILTEPRSKAAKEAGLMSETARNYQLELIAAAITGMDKVGGKSAAVDRGIDKEADAIRAYEEKRMIDVAQGRLLIHKGLGIGASPDGFVEEDDEGPGLIEVKCPEPKTHLENWLNAEEYRISANGYGLPPAEYAEQVAGQQWVAGREWTDFISFDDRFPGPMQLAIVRVRRDADTIALLADKVPPFADAVRTRIRSLQAYIASCLPEQAAAVRSALQKSLETPSFETE